MNTDPAETRSRHLDLEDLIAGAAGQPASDRAAGHLASCAQCRAEARRWEIVAAGVRGLADATPAARPAPAETAPPRWLGGPRRRAVLAAAAAVLVLLGGAGYWAASAVTGQPSGAVLTAVSGCTGLELATGTLEQVSGRRLVIGTAGGHQVTVTTTASTRVTIAGVLLRLVTDGAPVIVLGPRSGGTIAAASVTVGPPPGGHGNGTLRVTPPPGWAVARGAVADASGAGFTVVTSGGTRIPVTTTGGTKVVVPDASLGQLQPGITTVAVGRARSDRALTAAGVLQQPAGSSLQVQFSVPVRGCPRAALAGALAAALARG